MPIIDMHVHIFPDELAAKAVPALEAVGDFAAQYDGTVAGLLSEMERSGVDLSVAQPVATKPSQVRIINDWIAGIIDPRILPFGAMHPNLPDPAQEIEYMAEAGLRGFKLHPEHQDFELHEPRMQAIYAAAVRFKMIVFFHAGGDVIHSSVRGTPEAFASLLDDWPDMTAVLAHMGGFRQWEGVSERLAGRDVWFDTAYTLPILPPQEFVALTRAHGADHVLFGSDGPWTNAAVEIEKLRSCGLEPDEIDGILGGNAARLLGL
ncbi:MAG: amidohydrolase family protein [Coriobacteriia bacterium]